MSIETITVQTDLFTVFTQFGVTLLITMAYIKYGLTLRMGQFGL